MSYYYEISKEKLVEILNLSLDDNNQEAVNKYFNGLDIINPIYRQDDGSYRIKIGGGNDAKTFDKLQQKIQKIANYLRKYYKHFNTNQKKIRSNISATASKPQVHFFPYGRPKTFYCQYTLRVDCPNPDKSYFQPYRSFRPLKLYHMTNKELAHQHSPENPRYYQTFKASFSLVLKWLFERLCFLYKSLCQFTQSSFSFLFL